MSTAAPPRPELQCWQSVSRGRRALIRLATPADASRIRGLYREIYHGRYPLSIIYDLHETVESLHKDNYFWFVSEVNRQIVGSVIFCLDPEIQLAKVFGGVVRPEFRGFGLTEKAMSLGLRHLVEETQCAQSVYATARTVSPAPQKLLRKLGFRELGIFPNVRKIDNYETHCLTAYFKEGALGRRIARPRLPLLLKPFYDIVRRSTGIEDAQWRDIRISPPSPWGEAELGFELIEAKNFILSRWNKLKAEDKLRMQFFPFHEPNLMLVTEDQAAEIYIHYSKPDHHAVIIGGHESVPDLARLLNAVGLFLEEHGVRYLELLADAYHPGIIQKVMEARFLPSAYYPAMRWKHGKGRDYIVFSKTFTILDFKHIAARGLFSEYLREYFRLWKSLYIDF
ncbi:MAG: GNAT family N-acetyltransferase [Elusimicrobia bacterium]|nr:GNAT family N-acetyltransferase [Elusimicrobiota bacterium]